MLRRILLIDDDALTLRTLQEMLARFDYEVYAFQDPREALKKLTEGSFDCVVSDVMMPEMSGLELAGKAHQLRPDMPIVLITGMPDLDMVVDALRAGASDFLVKPILSAQLGHVVQRTIERADLSRSLRQRNAELAGLLDASGALAICENPKEVARVHADLRQRLKDLSGLPETIATLDNMASQVMARLAAFRHEEQVRLGALLESHPAGILYLDAGGTLLVASRRAKAMLGGESTADSPAWSMPGGLLERIKAAITAGGAGEIVSPGDSNRLLRALSGPVYDEGRRLGTVVSLSDVTEERERDMKVFLAARLATVGEIVAGLSHELNNPLAIVLGYAQELKDNADPQVKDFATRIESAAARCSDLFRKMKPLLSPAAEMPGPVDLAEPCRAVADVLAGRLELGKIRLETEFGEAPPVRATLSEMKEIVLALAINAIDSMENGGCLTIRTGKSDGAGALLEVADTGHGIEPSLVPRLFDPFFTTKPVGKGTGLGLTLVHAITSRLGGAIKVASNPGQGTRFELRFPAA